LNREDPSNIRWELGLEPKTSNQIKAIQEEKQSVADQMSVRTRTTQPRNKTTDIMGSRTLEVKAFLPRDNNVSISLSVTHGVDDRPQGHFREGHVLQEERD